MIIRGGRKNVKEDMGERYTKYLKNERSLLEEIGKGENAAAFPPFFTGQGLFMPLHTDPVGALFGVHPALGKTGLLEHGGELLWGGVQQLIPGDVL